MSTIQLSGDNHPNEDVATRSGREAGGGGSPMCEKCGAPITTSDALVCRQCGWYASIGSYIEIDRDWEVETDPEFADAMHQHADEAFRVPAWAWTMIACTGAVIAESVAVRVLIDAEDPLRMQWSVAQLAVGALLFAVCHGIVFLLLINRDSEVGLLDILLKPIRPWADAFGDLPQKQWLCHTGVSGVTAILMSLLVIGSLPYERLLDWGFKKPPKQNLMGAVMSRAQQIEGKDQTLEEAVQDLGGSQNLDGGGGGDKKTDESTSKPDAPERVEQDCVILGYRANDDGLAYLLILAGESGGQLRHLGQVTPSLPLNELRELSQELAENPTNRPFLPMQMERIQWVTPTVTCRVSYIKRGKKGAMYDVKLESILGEIQLPGSE